MTRLIQPLIILHHSTNYSKRLIFTIKKYKYNENFFKKCIRTLQLYFKLDIYFCISCIEIPNDQDKM